MVRLTMKRTISDRLARLEARNRPAYLPQPLKIHLINPGDMSVAKTLVMEAGKPHQWVPGPPDLDPVSENSYR